MRISILLLGLLAVACGKKNDAAAPAGADAQPVAAPAPAPAPAPKPDAAPVAVAAPADAAPAAATQPTAAASQPAESQPAAASQPTAAAPATGIPECDQLLTDMVTCSEKMPPDMRQPIRDTVTEDAQMWREAASSSPEAKKAIADSCVQARDAMAQAMSSFGCTFTGVAAPPAEAKAPATAPTIEFEESGVPECDDFMRKYLACVETKLPEASRAQVRDAMKQASQSWKQAATTPEVKKMLADTCIKMSADTKKGMESMGCTW